MKKRNFGISSKIARLLKNSRTWYGGSQLREWKMNFWILAIKKNRNLKKIVKSKRFNSHNYGEIIKFFTWNRRGITLHSQNHWRTIKSRNCIHQWKKEAIMDPSYTQKLRNSPKKCPETPSDAILILVIANYFEFCKYFKIVCTYRVFCRTMVQPIQSTKSFWPLNRIFLRPSLRMRTKQNTKSPMWLKT